MADNQIYRGRFAPSPTGALHFGSLLAAVGSYLDAKHNNGEWLVRVEDIDPPREVPGSADDILRALEAFGLQWDGPVIYQGQRNDLYQDALDQLERNGHLFGCACTRSEIRAQPDSPGIYPGTCRDGLPAGRAARALRVRVGDASISVYDKLQGRLQQDLATEVGDFIVRRADGLVAYQLAVVVDDAAQGITDVVRGADLWSSTPRQCYLQQLLDLARPRYLHLPVAVNAASEKLAKQTLARAVAPDPANRTLLAVLDMLQQTLPANVGDASQAEILQWAIDHWSPAALPRHATLAAPTGYSD